MLGDGAVHEIGEEIVLKPKISTINTINTNQFFRIMAEALIETNNDVSSVVKGNPSQYVKLNVGGSLHYTTIGWFKKKFFN